MDIYLKKFHCIINTIVIYLIYLLFIFGLNKLIPNTILCSCIINILIIGIYCIYLYKKKNDIKFNKIDSKNTALMSFIFITLFLFSCNISTFIYKNINDTAFTQYSNIIIITTRK